MDGAVNSPGKLQQSGPWQEGKLAKLLVIVAILTDVTATGINSSAHLAGIPANSYYHHSKHSWMVELKLSIR